MGGGVPGCHSMASAARALRRARYSGSTAPGWLSLRWTVTSPSPERVTGAYSWASSNIAASGVSGRRTARRRSVAADWGGASSRWTGLVLKSGLHALDNSCTPFRTVKAELPCKRHAKPDWAQGRLSRTASFCGSACDQQEMWPDAELLWHIGAAAGDIKYGVPRGRNFPSFLQVRQVSPGPATDCPPRHSRNAQQSIQSPGRPTGQQCPAKPAKVASEFMLLQPCPAQPSPAQRRERLS